MSIPGGWELIVIVMVLLLLFGAKRIPSIMKSFGATLVETKKALKDISK